jgi:predicted nuclease of predicted toxin-antitoxin system
MRFLLDESADYPLAPFLQSLGHNTTSIVRDYSRSLKDTEVLEIAKAEDRILITNDKDFGELVFRRRLSHAGIILFRLTDEDLAIKKEWLTYLLNQHPHQLKQFIVISDRGIRIRRITN